jgi:protoporphyrinogen oxidase
MEGDHPIKRRTLLRAAPGLLGLTAKADRVIAGSFVNDGFPLGHRLRDRTFTATPKQEVKIPLVIIGGGCAGLSAGWWLRKKNFRDFVLLEMEREIGGNARWSENEVSRYPWAAHYLPVPNKESTLVRELCQEMGLLENGVWNELHLCHSPQERLFLHGRWQDGVEPEIAATKKDREQYARFAALMKQYRASGEFTKPIDLGWAKRKGPPTLDQITMQDWLNQLGFDSPYLRWLVDYSCRDDYGGSAANVSAWAGIHEFASREPDEKGPLTWPEGNGYLSNYLQAKLQPQLRANSPVISVRAQGPRLFRIVTPDTAYLCEAVIFAAPTYLAHYLIEGAPKAEGFVYSPWITANLTLDRLPRGGETSWDNVIYDSPSLGYVVATHMTLHRHRERSVWTYYWALVDQSPALYRQMLLDQDWAFWKNRILDDLARPHPDIRQCVARIDIMRLGHAMARPAPGVMTSPVRQAFATSQNGIFYANSDLSGLSIFEEAQHRGVTAAQGALRRLGRSAS